MEVETIFKEETDDSRWTGAMLKPKAEVAVMARVISETLMVID